MRRIAIGGLLALALVGCGNLNPPVEEGVVTEKENGNVTIEAEGQSTTHKDVLDEFYERVQVGDTVEISDEEYGIEWER